MLGSNVFDKSRGILTLGNLNGGGGKDSIFMHEMNFVFVFRS